MLKLPSFEYSCETFIHKNIYSPSHILLIPKGMPSYIWMNHKGTFLLNKKDEKRILCSINPSLTKGKGTILYGIYFQYRNVNFFATEDIIYYKGENISRNSFQQKLNIFDILMKKEIQQQPTNDVNEVIIGLPIFVENDNLINIHNIIENTPYPIQYIQFRQNNKRQGNHRFQLYYKEQYRIMNISAEVEYDIYNVSSDDNKTYGYACIPDYKTSVLLNSIFRNIKENTYLDAIEESDVEEVSDGALVDINKKCKMKCKYHLQFKKWVPIELIETKEV